MSGNTNTLYDQLIQVTNVYLGPAAERFIDRQVKNHLDIEPKSIKPEELNGIIDWIKVAVSLTTDDKEIVEEYEAQLRRLATKSKPKTAEELDDKK